jgi:hypothetical protein
MQGDYGMTLMSLVFAFFPKTSGASTRWLSWYGNPFVAEDAVWNVWRFNRTYHVL